MTEPADPQALFIPWSEDGKGLKGELTEAYITSFVMEEIIPMAHKPFHFRVDHSANYHFLAFGGSEITEVDGKGKTVGSTPLPSDQGRVLDYVPHGDGYWILYANGPSLVLVSKGVGQIEGVNSEIGSYKLADPDQILYNGTSLYLTSNRSQANLLQIDPEDGSILQTIERKVGGKPSAYLSDERILTVAYFPDHKARGISIRHLKTGEEKALPFGDQWYGPLVTAFGADDQARITLFTNPAFGGNTGLLRLDDKGVIDGKLETEGLAQPGSTLFSGQQYEGRLTVQVPGSRIPVKVWDLPEELKKQAKNRYEYAGPNENGAHVFYQRDEMGYYKNVLTCSDDPKISVRRFEKGEVITRMQPTSTWQVLGDGSLLIPITTPEGLQIIKFSF